MKGGTIKGGKQEPGVSARLVALIAVAALVLTLVSGATAAWISGQFHRRGGYFLDPAFYQGYSARLAVRLEDESPLQLAGWELGHNQRHPLRTVPLLLAAPGALAHPLGHLATALPMLGIYLLLLGYTLLRRTGHAGYSLAAMVLFCCLPGMFSPTFGLGAFWLDLHASFLAGAALLCLLNSNGARDLRWLVAFGVLAGLTTLARFVAAGYVLVMAGPPLAAFLVGRWRQEKHFGRAVLVPALAAGAPVVLLVGAFLASGWGANMHNYAVYGYALGQGPVAAGRRAAEALLGFLGPKLLAALAGLSVAGLWLLRAQPQGPEARRENAALVWMAGSHLAFVILVLGANQAHTPLFAVAPLFLLLVSPAVWERGSTERTRRRAAAGLALGLLAAAGAFGGRHALAQYQLASNPGQHRIGQQKMDAELARHYSALGKRLVIKHLFGSDETSAALATFYAGGGLPLHPTEFHRRSAFSPYAFNWPIDYPGKSSDQVAALVYEELSRWVDVVATVDDPAAARGRFSNPFTEAIAMNAARRTRTEPRWRHIATLDTYQYGRIRLSRNTDPQADGYQRMLRSNGSNLP
jgi:fluoride ion exporter CrcB/FEX